MAATRLVLKLVGGVVYSVAAFAVPLFVGAWTLHWWRAWVFLAVVLVASSITMFGIFPGRPELLDERYKAPIQKGQPRSDKVLTPLLLAAFFGLLLFVPLDVFRFHVVDGPPPGVADLGLVLFAAGWGAVALALRENAFAVPVVKYQEERGQRVVDTGPYRIVRHPMYGGAILLMVGMPLWLGSIAGALLAGVPVGILALRTLAEERLLRRDLHGYEDYARRVRWRLVPFVW